MDEGVEEAAEILDGQIARRDTVRLAASIEIDADIRIEVERRFEAARDAVESFHRVSLGGREGAGFIRYPDGGFYRSHRDRAVVPSWPGAARRRIALVVFLNSSHGDEPGEFSGGVLRLFGGDSPLDVYPEAGLLVAFAADTLHEVSVVRGGTRDAIVDWFYDESS